MTTPLVVGSMRGGITEFILNDRGTYTATAAISGGQLLEATAGDRQVQPAQADSVVCVGVALHDAAIGDLVTVACAGTWPVTVSGAMSGGARLKAAAAGVVQAAGATPDARKVIGWLEADVADGAIGRVHLTLG